MPSHIIYIDDSGTKEYAVPPARYGANNSRYFVFGGILLTTAEAGNLTSKIVTLKLNYFGTEDVEIKSNWLRRPSEHKPRYLDPYGISEADLKRFVLEYYQHILGSELVLLAAIVDKEHMTQMYGEKAYYPSAVAYECLLQRVENELSGKGTFSVTIDDMTGGTPKGNPYKTNLQHQHEHPKKHGSRLRKGFKFTALEGRLKFTNSAHNQIVQAADVTTYNVYRQFTDHGLDWEKSSLAELPTYEWFERLSPKFRKDSSGRIQGYGIVKFPILERIPWSVSSSEQEKEATP